MTAAAIAAGSTMARPETSSTAAPKLRKKRDILRTVLAVWCGIVMVFLFIPIALVILHSFNRGGSFSIWSGHTSTKWWGTLFAADKMLPALLILIVVTLVASFVPLVVRVTTGLRHKVLSQWAGPLGFLLGVVIVGLTSDWFRNVFREKGIGDALRNSFIAAIGATFVAVVLGGLAGVALARNKGWWNRPFMVVVFLILVTPEIMDAIALAGWFQRVPFHLFTGSFLGFAPGMLSLWVGESLYASAVVTLIVRARLAGIDSSLEEAASDLGAPPGRAFRQITLPLISSALIAGGLLSFTICLDNTIIAQLVSNAGSSTFPVFLISQLRSTVKPFVGAAAVVLFAVTVGALGFVAVVLKRSGDSSSQIAATLAGG